MFRGRAAERLAADASQVPSQGLTECGHEDLASPSRVHVDPFGNLHLCQGLVMGNLSRSRMKEIVAGYQPLSHPVIAPLLQGGPLQLAKEHGLPVRASYADACQLCYESRRALRVRALAAVRELEQRFDGEPIVVVTHLGWLRALAPGLELGNAGTLWLDSAVLVGDEPSWRPEESQ